MERLQKAKRLSFKSAEPDMALINQFSVKELSPEDVYCFSVVLCDNDIDRDLERFTNDTLKELAPMFVGKTVISDHHWKAENQVARIYKTAVVETTKENALGEPLVQMQGDVYMLNNEANKSLIEAIEGGIIKEVSISCIVKELLCSLCGSPLRFDFRTWTIQCETGHIKGEVYDGKRCVGELTNADDAYELSFVAVPSQRCAGVIKSQTEVDDAVGIVVDAELSHEQCDKLMQKLKITFANHEEMAIRAKILKDNENFLRKGD